MPISQLIFDCDGVLVDSEILATRITLNRLQSYGIHMDELTFSAKYSGMLTEEILVLLEDEYDVSFPESLAKELFEEMENCFDSDLEPVPGMPELIKSLPPIAKNVVSNGHGEHVKRSLKITGLESKFGEEIFGIERVDNGKPSPDLYLLAHRYLKST